MVYMYCQSVYAYVTLCNMIQCYSSLLYNYTTISYILTEIYPSPSPVTHLYDCQDLSPPSLQLRHIENTRSHT